MFIFINLNRETVFIPSTLGSQALPKEYKDFSYIFYDFIGFDPIGLYEETEGGILLIQYISNTPIIARHCKGEDLFII